MTDLQLHAILPLVLRTNTIVTRAAWMQWKTTHYSITNLERLCCVGPHGDDGPCPFVCRSLRKYTAEGTPLYHGIRMAV
jgi:hypothetical protein